MKNPQDSTLRNVRALNKKLQKLAADVKALKAEVKEIKRKVK